ncbi:MAG TPA: tRNA (adenosine(37)-N6)-threonylcarbamoyltransferase complex dimerization subunit type 1 TsaB [Candidatus Limnocylindria bacterium]
MIVAIESASADVSIALADPDGTLRRVDGWSAGQRQSHELLPRIAALLQADGSALTAVRALAVGIGPGSFTGLRVGMSVAKGLAVALDRPIVGVPSLPAWLESEPQATAAVARAGARDAYLLRRGAAAPEIVDRDLLAGLTGPLLAAAELIAAFEMADGVQPLRAAAAVARQAAVRLGDDPTGDDLSRLEPAYLRAPRGVSPAAAGGS